MNMPFLRKFPRLHDLFVFLHFGEVTRKPEFSASFAAVVDETVVEGVELGVAGDEVGSEDFVVGFEGFDVGFHAAEVFVGGELVDLEGRRRRVRDVGVFELLGGTGFVGVGGGGLGVEGEGVFDVVEAEAAVLVAEKRLCEVSYTVQTNTGRL